MQLVESVLKGKNYKQSTEHRTQQAKYQHTAALFLPIIIMLWYGMAWHDGMNEYMAYTFIRSYNHFITEYSKYVNS